MTLENKDRALAEQFGHRSRHPKNCDAINSMIDSARLFGEK